jgi:hypothetical protein
MNLIERLKKIESKFKNENISVEIIFYNEGEDLQDILKQKEKELNKEIDNPIFIKIIPNKEI